MKTIIFFISFFFVVISCNLFPQEKQLFGFGDLDWNSSKEQVKALMKSRYDLSPGYEKEDAIGYQGGKYFKEDLFLWVYFFNNDSLQEVDLVVKSNDRPVGAIFYEVVHTLSVDYGDPDLYKPDDWTAEWFYYDFPGKKLKATIKVSPYAGESSTTVKISFLKAPI